MYSRRPQLAQTSHAVLHSGSGGGGGGGAGFTLCFFTHDIISLSGRRDTDFSKGRKAVVGQIRNCTDF